MSTDAIEIAASQLSNLELLRISVTDSDPDVATVAANTVPVTLGRFISKTGTFRDRSPSSSGRLRRPLRAPPNVRLNLALALMLGLILGGGLALLKESVADRIGSVDELEGATRQPVIAVIPNLKFAPLVRQSRLSSRRRLAASTVSGGDVTSIEPAEGAAAGSRWGTRG